MNIVLLCRVTGDAKWVGGDQQKKKPPSDKWRSRATGNTKGAAGVSLSHC